MAREYHYLWRLELASSPGRLWPLVADTNRFNRETGLPALRISSGRGRPWAARAGAAQAEDGRPTGRPYPDSGPRTPDSPLLPLQRLAFHRLGVLVEWDEEPFEWERPRRLGVMRRYHAGPVKWMRVLIQLEPKPGGGTQLDYEVWAAPRNALGYLAIPGQIGLLSARDFQARLRAYDRHLASGAGATEMPSALRLDHQRLPRLEEALARVQSEGGDTEALARLARLLREGEETVLMRLRPYALARDWGLGRRAVLEACLRLARLGMLDLRWDLVCPLCRGAKAVAPRLDGLPVEVHCESCMIDYQAEFDRSVELSFKPNAALRAVEQREYCIGGPQVTPHVVLQQILEPGATRTLSPALPAGELRLRVRGRAGGLRIEVSEDAAAPERLRVDISPAGWTDAPLRMRRGGALTLCSALPERCCVLLEDPAPGEERLSAAELGTVQLFRDLFSREVLRPGETQGIGSLALCFTDLRGSTALYRRAGDGPAFGLVMDHFALLRGCVTAHGGAVVKTMGDAVLAVFPDPADALAALMQAQARMREAFGGRLGLKAGLHWGPCIAVTLNERLDYLGTSVNLAARLPGLGSAGATPASAAAPAAATLLSPSVEGRLDHASASAQVREYTSAQIGAQGGAPGSEAADPRSARLGVAQNECSEGVVISAETYADPRVQALIAAQGWQAEPRSVTLRGFEPEEHQVWVVRG